MSDIKRPIASTWICSSCTLTNPATVKNCTVCNTIRSKPQPFNIKLIVPGLNQPIILESINPAITIGYLRDLIEAATRIPDSQQRLYYHNEEIIGLSTARLLDSIYIEPGTVAVFELKRTEIKKSPAANNTATAPTMNDTDADAGDDTDADGDTELVDADTDIELTADDDDWGEMNSDGDNSDNNSDSDSIDSDTAGINAAAAAIAAVEQSDNNNNQSMDLNTSTHGNYTVLKPAQLQQRMNSVINELVDLLGLSFDQVSILCRHYRWARQQIIDSYFADSNKTAKAAGIGTGDSVFGSVPKSQTEIDCEVCADTVAIIDSLSLACNHYFCNICWSSWVVAEFDKGQICIHSTCPSFKCPMVIPYSVYKQYLSNDRYNKYINYLLDDFINGSKNYKYCPGANCNYSIESLAPPSITLTGVECNCGYNWCFQCRLEDHRPATCKTAAEWQIKNNSDAENINWILANTKICPNCKVPIEKNQGCNHMTCRSCSHEFCWLCKGNWKNHSSCALYTADGEESKTNPKMGSDANNEAAIAEKARNELQRYMHYWTRFDNHQKSIKFAEKSRLQASQRMEKLQVSVGTGLQEVSFLLSAVNAIIRSRRTLQWTYVYAYYLSAADNSSARHLFNEQQARLEDLTDSLHEKTEKLKPINSNTAAAAATGGLVSTAAATLTDSFDEQWKHSRTDIISGTRTLDKYRTNLIDAVARNNEELELSEWNKEMESGSGSTATVPVNGTKLIRNSSTGSKTKSKSGRKKK